MPSLSNLLFSLALTLPAAHSHMLLAYPQPFAISDQPDNGPLVTAANGGPGNYPCKSTGSASDFEFSFARTEMALGSNQTLKFTGSAVHGGGSCQISLTKDLAPSANSDFRVIHSIIGGCPARNTAGNLEPASAAAPDPNTYDVTIPADLEAGDYTLSWSWFNKVGNREFYQNCAPITLTGGASKRDLEIRDDSAFEKLPHMFIGNIPEVPSQCSTSGIVGANLEFQEPGDSVERNNPSDQFMQITGDLSGCYAPLGGGSGSSGSASKSPSSSGSSGSANAPNANAPSPAATTTSAPSATSPASNGGAETSAAPAPTSTPVTTPTTGSGSCAAGSVPCTLEGFQCISSSQFGLCANGCMIPQAVAAGTICADNAIAAAPMFKRRSPMRIQTRVRHQRRALTPPDA